MRHAGLIAMSASPPKRRTEAAFKLAARQPAISNQAALRTLLQGEPHAPLIQPKLEIGGVDDPLEREADAVAERVMRMPDAAVSVARSSPQVSRKCAACEAEDASRKKPVGAAQQSIRIDGEPDEHPPPTMQAVVRRKTPAPLIQRTATWDENGPVHP